MKLHGSRVQQHRNFQSSGNIDTMVEANEQNIEVEFLRLFDYARCERIYILTQNSQNSGNFSIPSVFIVSK